MSTPEVTSVRSAGELATMAALPPPPLQPFADDRSGFAYFSSDYHHRHLATVIFGQLAKGHGFVLISGEPAADGELLERFLTEEGKQHYRATLLRCRPGMDFGDLVRAYNRRLGLKQEAGSDGIWSLLSHLMLELRRGITRILVLANAEALDVSGFDELLRFTRLDQPHVMPVVMLAEAGFAEQLAAPHFEFMRSAITGRLAVDRLEPEEVGAFIRYQLNALAQDEDALFPAETVGAIAAAAAGSPAEVNRLAREALAAAGRRGQSAGGPSIADDISSAPLETAATPCEAQAEAAEPLTLEEPFVAPASVAPHTVPDRRRLRLPSSLAAGAYVLAVSLCGLGLLYLLAPRMPHEPAALVQAAAPAPASATAPAAVTAVDSETAPAPDIARNEPPAFPPSTVEDGPPGIAAARSAAAIEPAAGTPVAAAAAVNSGPAPSPDAADETPPAQVTASPAPAQDVVSAAPAQDAAAATPPAVAQVATLETSPAPRRGQVAAAPSAEVALMVQRGDELLAAGDVVSARRFFERPAQAGDAAAECGLAKTYDALFLRQIGARGISGDAAMAIDWYRRAAAAGSSEAMARLARLNVPTPSRSIPEERR